MKIGVYYVYSNNVAGDVINEDNFNLIKRLSAESGNELELIELDQVNDYDLVFSFIGGGGTEGRFLQILDKLPRPVFLLTSGASNSLAASMEILSYLRQNDIQGEIIHGSENKMATKIANLAKVFKTRKTIRSLKIGRVGKPSDWLISSDVDAEKSKELNGIEIIDIPMQEFFDEIAKKQYEENEFTKLYKEGCRFPESEIELSLHIYGALKRICTKYGLKGVTVRCFDLLEPIKGTGCMALAILNSEGIYAGCEGDTPALISMVIIGELSGEKVFMANPSRIDSDNNQIIFAHCTLPITMPDKLEYMTHFESGLGVAIRGKITEGPITVFKASGLLDEYYVDSGTLLENLNEFNLCRTQIRLQLNDINYFLTESIGNHHLIVKGDHADLVDEFFRWL